MTNTFQLKMLPVTIGTVAKWIKMSEIGKPWDELAIEIVSLFYGITIERANTLTLESIVEAATKAIDRMAEIKSDATLIGEVDIKGKRFRFNKNLNEITFNKIVDIRKLGKGIIDRPGYMLAVLYDEVGEPTLTRSEKEVLFLSQFPVQEFLAVNNFFFRVSLLSKQITFLQNEAQKDQMKMSLIGISGQTRSTFWHKILTVTLTKSQRCAIHRYSSGKSILGRGAGWLKSKRNNKKQNEDCDKSS